MAQRDIAGSGYGCSHTVTSECLLDGHEFECSRSVCPLTAGHSVKDAEAGPRFQ